MRKLRGVQIGIIRIFTIILILNFIGYSLQGAQGIVEFFRAISGYYMFFFWGWCCYKIYYEKNRTNRLYRIIIYSAAWISIINVWLFIWLQTDDIRIIGWNIEFQSFQPVADYVRLLNKNFIDYIIISANYNDVGFVRGIGYFFDTHSQYYLPLCALAILILKKEVVKSYKLFIAIFVISILCSGIKTAYLTIVLCLVYHLFTTGYLIKYLKKLIPILILIIIIFSSYVKTIFLGEGMWKILIQLCQHIFLIPTLYLTTHPINFLLGGAPFLRDNPLFYSEVFWVTVTFYIGIIGLYIYIMPFKFLKHVYNNKIYIIPRFIYIIFFLSLTHYSVYMIGINNLASAIPVMFCFDHISNIRKE